MKVKIDSVTDSRYKENVNDGEWVVLENKKSARKKWKEAARNKGKDPMQNTNSKIMIPTYKHVQVNKMHVGKPRKEIEKPNVSQGRQVDQRASAISVAHGKTFSFRTVHKDEVVKGGRIVTPVRSLISVGTSRMEEN